MSACVNCRTPLVVIDLTIADEPTRVTSCSSCGRRRWSTGGDVIDLTEVLAAAAHVSPPRPDRPPPNVA